jgi:light-harvesting complex 1 beta chain
MVDDVRHGDRLGPSTYLTDSEAREFHSLFITSFIAFTIVAIIAHVLAWNWRPWIPGPDGYAMNLTPAIVAEAPPSAQA